MEKHDVGITEKEMYPEIAKSPTSKDRIIRPSISLTDK